MAGDVQTLENTDFTDVRPLFPPLMHTVCLVYSHSTYYNSAARIIVLMQVISKLNNKQAEIK